MGQASTLPLYPTVRALQWIDGEGIWQGLARAGWYRIEPVLVLRPNLQPWDAAPGVPCCAFTIEELTLL